MIAIAHYRQLDWLCSHRDASVDMVREFLKVAREVAELIAKGRRSTGTQWAGRRARVWTAAAERPTGAVILEATERWALLDSEVPLLPRTTAALEHHCTAPRATLRFHGDVALTDDHVALFVFDGPAISI